MAVPSKKMAEAIRREQKYIQQQVANGRSRNAIRIELMKEGMCKVSRAYFNEVVSGFEIDSTPAAALVSATQTAVHTVSSGSVPVTAVSQIKSAEPFTSANQHRGNFVDDRFDNDL